MREIQRSRRLKPNRRNTYERTGRPRPDGLPTDTVLRRPEVSKPMIKALAVAETESRTFRSSLLNDHTIVEPDSQEREAPPNR